MVMVAEAVVAAVVFLVVALIIKVAVIYKSLANNNNNSKRPVTISHLLVTIAFMNIPQLLLPALCNSIHIIRPQQQQLLPPPLNLYDVATVFCCAIAVVPRKLCIKQVVVEVAAWVAT